MEDNSPERLDKSLTRLEMAHQLSETAGLILADVNKLVAYLASVDANGDGMVDEAVNFTLKGAGKIRKHATAIRYGISNALENPFASQRKPKPEPEPAANKEEPMSQTTTPKITAGTITTTNPTPRDITTTEVVPEKHYENPRAIIANALVGIYDSISALQRAAYQANDKVVYGFATKLMNGELMDIKANYSKDAK